MTDPDGFFNRRWRGHVEPSTLLWRDALGVGTAVNLLASFAALMLVAQGGDSRYAVALHLAPVPYNAFLALAVWRTPRRLPWHGAVVAAWFAVMLVL